MASPGPVPRFLLHPRKAITVLTGVACTLTVALAVAPSTAPYGLRAATSGARPAGGTPSVTSSGPAQQRRASTLSDVPPVTSQLRPVAAGAVTQLRSDRIDRPPREPVAAAAPTRFRFTAPGITASARVCHMPDALALDPPGDPDTTVCWVRNNFGEAPGSSSRTSYVLGHSFANDPGTALGRISRTASAQLVRAPVVYRNGVPTRPITALNGATLTLWTANGRLDYRVRDAFGVPKPQFGLVNTIVDDSIARRVVLVTCSVHGDQDLDYNVIVEAFLYSSERTAPA